MKRLTLTALAALALAAALAPVTSSQRALRPDCELPIRNAKPAGRFERQCGADGTKGATPAHRDQNRAKNNFCAAGRAAGPRPIDVCRNTTLTGCRNEAAWTPFDEWMKGVS